ncbi:MULTISPECIES: phosphoserine phosphatase SerB [unclassified Iodidimonas]|jgi:phosphoserine phosphatase|uniref:phosphoserine phosphatase SerB n=1 Tax=unclassified Iodidimonas TaxID=2626145 RepID=UPI002482A7E0|nr:MULTISPECIES: phosphoserine phosphatase SerB [unclassified Iodidimonas]
MPETKANAAILTLIAKPRQGKLALARDLARSCLSDLATPLDESLLAEHRALDIAFRYDPRHQDLATIRKSLDQAFADHPDLATDIAVQDAPNRRKALLIADMDSTMITVECIDELADFAGIKDKIALITEAAMRGELDFEAALHERVALLSGLDEATLLRCYEERVTPMSGAETLVKTMRAHGAYCLLVSGGFTFFTSRIAQHLGFDDHRANVLDIEGGRLTGRVRQPIIDANSKLTALEETAKNRKLHPSQIMAVGDGANDIPMIKAAGLGIAYHAKPKTAAAADLAIHHNDLSALLYIQGYRDSDFYCA